MIKKSSVSVIILLTLLWFTNAFIATGTELSQPGEYEVKAAYLYNFTKFVEWPRETTGSGRSVFTVCILGKNPFGDALDAIVGKTVKNRRLTFKKITSIEEVQDCDMVFISDSEKTRLKSLLNSLNAYHGILTVSDSTRFALNGGMIGFVYDEGKIRFEINNRAARQANLQISSHLLRLAAKIVE